MTVHLQCILPCKYKYENHLCCYNSNWHGKHGCHRYTHWHLRTKMNCQNVTRQKQTSEFFFFYFLSLMQWLYRGMTVRPQCILPYRCSCESRQCWYSLQSRHKHGCYWGTHRYLVVVWYRYRILHRKSVCMVFTHKLVVSEIESVIILAGLRFRPAVIILVPRSLHVKYRHWSSFTCD